MIEDAAVRSHLEEVVRQGSADGPLSVLCTLIDTVWRRNLDRQDSEVGDDAVVLGVQCSRNILHLAKPIIGQIEEVEADGARTLEVRFAGKTLHVSKVTSRDPAWSPQLITWDNSDVRLRAAQANTQVYAPSEGTLFASLLDGVYSPLNAKPETLPFLHLAWQGLEEGGTRVFVGFPQINTSPWLAVKEIANGRPGTGGMPMPTDVSPTPSPDHDTLAEPEVALKRRRPSAEEEGSSGSGRS